MKTNDIIAQLDAEIARLQGARALLASVDSVAFRKGRLMAGRAPSNQAKPPKKKRNLTAEGRARIAAAVRRRWAKQKAAKKVHSRT